MAEKKGSAQDEGNVLGPLIAFVNTKSGGRVGLKLFSKITGLLGPDYVFDLGEGGPEPGLQKFKGKQFRILVCGGDGSVGWVLGKLDQMDFAVYPPIAILPLGTGNDLSRTLNWGGGYSGESLVNFIRDVHKSKPCKLDRWKVTCVPLSQEPSDSQQQQTTPTPPSPSPPPPEGEAQHPQEMIFKMNNYFSIGGDAEIAMNFHGLREKKRGLFASRLVNKGWYGFFSLKTFLTPRDELRKFVSVELDGKPLELPSTLHTLMILNLPSWAGGAQPWRVKSAESESAKKKSSTKEKPFIPSPQTLDDNTFEVLGFFGVSHMARTIMHISQGKRLGQGKVVKIRNTRPIPAQVDGEPFLLISCDTEVTHLNQANMLFNVNSDKVVKKFNDLTHEPATSELNFNSEGSLKLNESKTEVLEEEEVLSSPNRRSNFNILRNST